MTILRNAALALVLAGATATAHAGVKLSAVRTNFFSGYGHLGTFVPLNDAGATTLTFNLASSGKKVLTYSVVCHVSWPAYYVDLDIIVNGVAVPPTANVAQFCSPPGNDLPMFAQHSVTLAIQGIKGTNTVRILAKGADPTASYSLNASSLVVHD